MYNKVLVAIDLTERPTHRVLEGAMSFLGDETRFDVLHVVEPRYVRYSFDPTLTGSITHSLEKTTANNG